MASLVRISSQVHDCGAARGASQTLMLVVPTCRSHTTTEGWRHAGVAPQAAWDTEIRRARWSQGSQHCELQQSRQWAAVPGSCSVETAQSKTLQGELLCVCLWGAAWYCSEGPHWRVWHELSALGVR